MFETLANKLQNTFDSLTGRGSLSENDVEAALREIRLALLEADVALPVVKQIVATVRTEAVGEKVLKSVTPGQQVVKIVHEALITALGEGATLNLNAAPPVVILMCGLQGSGKTTTTGKLAKVLKDQHKKDVLLASLDIYRPAAQEQLQTLAERVGVTGLPIVAGEKPIEITKRALAEARRQSKDVLILDTAGRLELDADLMDELQQVRALANPTETILVADALTGQVAVQVATAFNEQVGITGLILTRIDGDGRGGAALSMRAVTGVPIKFLGLGEGMDALETFRPEGLASRILGQGDVVALVEKAQAAVNEDDAKQLEEKLMSGKKLDFNDMKKQLKMMKRMGGMTGMLGLLPGLNKLKDKVDPSKLDDKVLVHQMAVIDSMTPAERRQPQLLNAKRRKRIAAGAGLEVSDVNKLVKMVEQMDKMSKMMKKMGGMGALSKLMK